MFRIVVVLCALAQVASATTSLSADSSFETFMKHFGLKYKANEMAERRALFAKAVAEVRSHPRSAGYSVGLNKFSAMTSKEKRGTLGFSKTKQHLTDTSKYALNIEPETLSELPASVDWTTELGVSTPVKNQGQCGSCWSFAATAVLESHVALNAHKTYDLSPQQFVDCAPNPEECGGVGGCEGSTADLAYEYLAGSDGMYASDQYPYYSAYGAHGHNLHCRTADLADEFSSVPVVHIDGYSVFKSVDTEWLMNAVATKGPVAINVDASTWHSYEGGVFQGCSSAGGNSDINHVVTLAGYGTDMAANNGTGQPYWLVRNSWSPDWGELGYIKLKREMPGENSCMMDVTPEVC
jgi:cathepsin L